jgi:alkylated DNA repair protein (DNA oxidative demethylase)
MSAKLAGFRYLPGFLAPEAQVHLLATIRAIVAQAPLYQPTMPRSGKPLSVMMTNCGALGWVSDKTGGYRYQATHPVTGVPWPNMPELIRSLWTKIADYPAQPEACLINYYTDKAKLGLHRDADEEDALAPVLSISLGNDAIFQMGGLKRTDAKDRLLLNSGDIVVLGGVARHAYHGITRILPGTSALMPEGGRFNLTLRRVARPDV